MIPVFLSIAGSDCSAGAGLQADLKTGISLGCYPLTAVSGVVNEVPGKVAGLAPMEADFVAAQIRLCLQTFPVRAVKTGMLYSPNIIRAVARELEPHKLPLVIDPVMIASAGEPLVLKESIEAYKELLFPQACLITPNIDELTTLCSGLRPATRDDLAEAATAMAVEYQCPILAKGGHLAGNLCTDVLAMPHGRIHSWSHPRTVGVSTHGTGCTLASAVTSYLAHGESLTMAVEHALAYTTQTIAASYHFPQADALNHRLQTKFGE